MGIVFFFLLKNVDTRGCTTLHGCFFFLFCFVVPVSMRGLNSPTFEKKKKIPCVLIVCARANASPVYIFLFKKKKEETLWGNSYLPKFLFFFLPPFSPLAFPSDDAYIGSVFFFFFLCFHPEWLASYSGSVGGACIPFIFFAFKASYKNLGILKTENIPGSDH